MKAPTERVYHENELYEKVRNWAETGDCRQSLWAVDFAEKMHRGQTRKGPEKVPYISHPLHLAAQAIAIGIADDDLIAVCLLHDVCEDCGVSPQELKVSPAAREAVRLVTRLGSKLDEAAEQEYYRAISQNKLASMVKLLDRCHNTAFLALGMKGEKLERYVRETEVHFYPLLDSAEKKWPEYAEACFLIRYQIGSTLQTIKALTA